MKEIYIKTRMTKMPEYCGECPKQRYGTWCAETGLSIIVFARPDWCPLRTEQEIKESE